jgi:hypothetical protein
MENRIVDNNFNWFASKFPGSNLRQDGPIPWLWLCRHGEELYLVNSSSEMIDEVSASNGGMQTVDDVAVCLESKSRYIYKNVEPNQAVKVDEYDGFYDLDFLIQVYIRIRSDILGHMELRSPLSKGGLKRNTALIWKKGKLGKDVQAENISS